MHIQSNILLVDEDLAWHHSSAATALWSGGFDVQLFVAVCVETKNDTGRVNHVTCHVLFANKRQYSNYRYVYVVVNFLSQLIFIFLLFWGMVMYADEFQTKEKQKLTNIKN